MILISSNALGFNIVQCICHSLGNYMLETFSIFETRGATEHNGLDLTLKELAGEDERSYCQNVRSRVVISEVS